MTKELVVIDTPPTLPQKWDYDESIQLTKQHIYKWRTLTIELVIELWIAKQKLKVKPQDARRVSLNKTSVTKTWTDYCQEIGSSTQVVNSWLKRFLPNGDEELPPSSIDEDLPSNVKLYEGDVLEQITNVEDESVDLLLTDPPYGVMDDYHWDAKDLIFLDGWLKAIQPKMKATYNGFIFCDARMQYEYEMIIRNYFPIKNRIIWIRKNMAKGRVIKDKFISSYEVIFFIGNRELNLPEDWGAERFDSCEFAVPQSNFIDRKLHPTQKPLDLIKRLVSVGSFKADTILDCFAGSGTTGIACQEVKNRNCILIEKDSNYTNTIKERFYDLGR